MALLSVKHISSPEACGKRIRWIREELLFSTRESFCQGSGFTTAALKGWELGWGGGLSLQGAKKMVTHCRRLNIHCTEAWLLHGIGAPAVDAINALPLTNSIKNTDEAHIAKELLLFRELDHAIDTMVNDDAMMPLYSKGDYVAGILTKEIEKIIGKECIILTDDNQIYIRIIKHGKTPGHYDLSCLNKRSVFYKKKIKNIPIKLAARIIWIRKPCSI